MSDRSFDSHWLPRRSSLYTHRRIDPDESESDVSSFLDLFRRPLLSSFRYIHNAQRRQRRRRDYAGRPPRMETAVAGSRSEHDPGFRVLRSMCVELLRCKRIAPFLPKLRKFLRRADYSLIQSTIREMATLESALSDLIDLFQIYLIRTRFVLRYVAIAMKSVTETLHKMVTYLEQVHLRPEERWVRFLRSNAAEARNLSISCRIHVYAQFLRNMGDVMRGYVILFSVHLSGLGVNCLVLLGIMQSWQGKPIQSFVTYAWRKEFVSCCLHVKTYDLIQVSS